jgi:hypothetical protein
MNEINLIQKIQSDFNKSKAKIINNNDNTSAIQKNFSSKYTEDISDSEDEDLVSYKKRNDKNLNDLPSSNSILSKSVKNTKKKVKSSKSVSKDNKKLSDTELSNHNEINDNSVIKDSEILSDIDSEPEPEYEYTEEFKNKVKDYVKNDDRIRELQAELKLLNNSKKAVEIEILKHLERLGETNVNITGGKLRINQYESKEGLKEDLIKEALSEKIKDPKIIEFIFEKINEKRIANGKIQKSIKRTFERGNKKDK